MVRKVKTQVWTCRTCDRYWTGTTQAHCAACHEHFSCASAFDAHVRGKGDERACVNPAESLGRDGEKLLIRGVNKHGPVWVYRDTRPLLKSWQKRDV